MILRENCLRHPEKAHRPERAVLRKPAWIRVARVENADYGQTRQILKNHALSTVREEAACPNRGECWSKRHATMMIMGDICTFCNVATRRPNALDSSEPERLAEAVGKLGLRHVVITSVDRDDLFDGGAAHFARTISKVRRACPGTTIEVLVPDFLKKGTAWEMAVDAVPDVFNHNLECVPRLYPSVRTGAGYDQSLRLLDKAKRRNLALFTRSGLMVGLGESLEKLRQVMDDMRIAGVDFLTVGQYLRTTAKHHPIYRFLFPEEFRTIEEIALSKGFLVVSAAPMTRSSFHADNGFAALQSAQLAQTASKELRNG